MYIKISFKSSNNTDSDEKKIRSLRILKFHYTFHYTFHPFISLIYKVDKIIHLILCEKLIQDVLLMLKFRRKNICTEFFTEQKI